MKVFHFITSKEMGVVKGIDNYKAVLLLLDKYPEAKDGAESFFSFLKEEREREKAYEKETGKLYINRPEEVPEDVTYYDTTGHRTKTALYCLERFCGKGLFDEYVWRSPEVQKAYTASMVAGKDWYDQFKTNPDAAVDYLDNLTDRTRYGDEFRKIEEAKKRGNK